MTAIEAIAKLENHKNSSGINNISVICDMDNFLKDNSTPVDDNEKYLFEQVEHFIKFDKWIYSKK